MCTQTDKAQGLSAFEIARPFKGLIRPLKVLIRPFKGLMRPFKGLRRPLKSLIRPLKYFIRPLKGLITSVTLGPFGRYANPPRSYPYVPLLVYFVLFHMASFKAIV